MTPAELALLPLLVVAIDKYWPAAEFPATVAAQIRAESNWKIDAHNRVRRAGKLIEWGCGLSQVTQVPGRFDALREATKMHADLRGWTWHNCTNTEYQIPYVVIRGERDTAYWARFAGTDYDARAFAVAAYNRGPGNIAKERTICRADPSCDAGRWFGHVAEKSATKRGAKLTGYQSDSWTINRNYVDKVMRTFSPRYTTILGYPDAERIN